MAHIFNKLKYIKNTQIFYFFTEYILSLFFQNLRKKIKNNNKIIKILIVEPYQLGDLISISSMLDPIKLHFKESEIYILTKKSNSEIYSKDSRVKEILYLDLPWTNHGKRNFFFNFIHEYKKLKSLQKYKFDYGLDTRGDIISQCVLKIVNCDITIGYSEKIGTSIKLKGLLLNTKVEPLKKYYHRYNRNRYLLTALGIKEQNLFPISFPILSPIISTKIIGDKIVLIHIGSGWIYRRWKLDNWKFFIENILKDYNLSVNLICGINENEQLDQLKTKLSNKKNINYIYSKSYNELYYQISSCDFFVGLDSGPLHIADCLNKPCLALFGPGISELWKPLSYNSHFIHNIDSFECHPCNQRECIHKDFNCMDAINVNEVLGCFNTMISTN
jgi:heptosyltransferase-3